MKSRIKVEVYLWDTTHCRYRATRQVRFVGVWWTRPDYFTCSGTGNTPEKARDELCRKLTRYHADDTNLPIYFEACP